VVHAGAESNPDTPRLELASPKTVEPNGETVSKDCTRVLQKKAAWLGLSSPARTSRERLKDQAVSRSGVQNSVLIVFSVIPDL
jgi:hypothetical protein